MMPTLGTTLNFSVSVYDKDPSSGGQLANAASITLSVSNPDGTTVNPGVLNPPASTGVYTIGYTQALSVGRYVGLWTITMPSGFVTTYSQVFEVTDADPGFLLSLAFAKKHLNIPSLNTKDDGEIREWIAAITEIVEFWCGPCIPQTVTQEYHDETHVMMLQKTPVISITSIDPFTNYGRSYSQSELAWLPNGRVQLKNRWPFYYGPFTVTYVAGRTKVPASIVSAVKIILEHMWETQRGASSLPFQAQDAENLPVGSGYMVPNRALELLKATDLGPSAG